jgi:hypothetical protein
MGHMTLSFNWGGVDIRNMVRWMVTLAAAAVLIPAGGAAAATFYVAPSGNDGNAGTASAPWASVLHVNAAGLQPGDSVLFQGGSSFSGLLQPGTSGAPSAPITFGSYGTGRANLTGGIALASRNWLVFDDVSVDTGAWRTAGSTRGITTSTSGSGVTDIVVKNCVFANVTLGLMLSNHLDARWSVSGSTIRSTRDSGILIYDPNAPNEVGGGNMTFTGNQLLDTGLDASLNYKKHGVYDIGHDITWRNNVISGFSEGGFSLRARGNVLEGNTISGGPYAIYYSPYDPTPGTTRIAYNTISNVSAGTITIDSSGTVANGESYVIANNTISAGGAAPGIRVIGTKGSIAVANNSVATTSGPPLRVDNAPGGGFKEDHNLFWSTGSALALGYLGTTYGSVAAYRAATGLGQADLSVDPSTASALVDAGTTGVSGASYSGDCAQAAWHYCGAAPDLGATESGESTLPPSPPPLPLTPPSALLATSVKGTSLTLTWTPSSDTRVTAYRVANGSTTLGTATVPPFAIGGLACGTTNTFSVVALDATGAASAPASARLTTAACPTPPPPADSTPTLSIGIANGQTIPTSFRVKAAASASGGIRNVTFWFDGLAPCVVAAVPYLSCAIKASKGGHTLRVRATGNNGQYTERTIHVWCDPARTTLSAASSAPAAQRRAAKEQKTATAKTAPKRQAHMGVGRPRTK